MIFTDSTGGIVLLDVKVDDSSYTEQELMGDDVASVKLSLAEYVDLPIGTQCTIGGKIYAIARTPDITMHDKTNYEYAISLERPQQAADRRVLINTVDGRISFSLTATALEHLQLFVDNMNRIDSGWSIGSCMITDSKCITYEMVSCRTAIDSIAETFKAEYIVEDKTISLIKQVGYLTYNTPLILSYGRGNGITGGAKKTTQRDNYPAQVVYVKGGERNIDPSTYGNKTLQLPPHVRVLYHGSWIYVPAQLGYDGAHWDNEQNYNPDNATIYSALGNIVIEDSESVRVNEITFDGSEIYPKREGVVSAVSHYDEDGDSATEDVYNITDLSIPSDLDFSQCQIAGQVMTIVFQSGMLAGKEFDIATNSDGDLTGYDHSTRTFKLVSKEIDGEVMPNLTYTPAVGDKYVVFGCKMPEQYIAGNNKDGASWDLFRQAVLALRARKSETRDYRIAIDPIWFAALSDANKAKFKLGQYVTLIDEALTGKGGASCRITRIRKEINNPNMVEIELSTVARKKSLQERLGDAIGNSSEAFDPLVFDESWEPDNSNAPDPFTLDDIINGESFMNQNNNFII